MTAEHLSAPSFFPLASVGPYLRPTGYYRSKLLIAPFMTNPLIAAAGPLFSLLERVAVAAALPPLSSIRDNIEHELSAFHSYLKEKGQDDEQDMVAHYLICATTDEILGKNYLRLYGKMTSFQAFTPLSLDEVLPRERFFDIVARLKEHPHQYLHLLEFAYYCLITGFEGKYHGRVDGRQILDTMIEELYQLIKHHRVYPPLQLFEEQSLEQEEKITKKPRPLWAFFLLALFCFALLYYGLSYVLIENQAKQLQERYPSILQVAHEWNNL